MAIAMSGKLASTILLIAVAVSSGTSAYFYQEQASQSSRADSLTDQAQSLQSQITSLNSQIDTLNGQISQLQILNLQLGGNNSQLTLEIQQLQSQVSQLEGQVSQLQAQLNLQLSRVMASEVTIDRQSFTVPSGLPTAVFTIGTVQYSGYLRVTWNSAARMSFGIHVFDVNVTTPFTTGGVYSIPVSSNATGNSWFQCLDYYFVNGVNACIDSITYSITYWF